MPAAKCPDLIENPDSILVYVGLDLLGDGLMKLSFLQTLRATYPQAKITWLAGKGKTVFNGPLAPLTEGLLDEIIEDAGIGNKAGEILTKPLKGRSFDLIIDTQRRFVTTAILKRITHRRFISDCAKGLLSDSKAKDNRPKRMVDQLLRLVSLARHNRPDAPLEKIPLPDLPKHYRTQSLALLPSGPRYLILAPGAGGRHKCWPLENFLAVGKELQAKGWQVVVLLGPQEAEWHDDIQKALPDALLPLSGSGAPAPDPLLTLALAQQCQAAVANDSGLGHLIAAADIPLVSLFGPTPPAKFAPECTQLTVLQAQDFPAPEGGEASAMANIPLAAVFKALQE